MSRYAAIDIGSNSIRMLAAEVTAEQPMKVLAASRQVVRLGTGVFRDGRLTEGAMNLACDALRAMTDQYRKLDVIAARAVGTSALRDASNSYDFLDRARRVLGAPVEVISGLEEARLIHLGVQACWPQPQHRLLVLDIGGGSAELIFSEGGRILDAYSKPLGAVRLTEVFLRSDPPDAREMARMKRYIQERIAGAATRFGGASIDRMIATSATAAAAVCAVNRVRRSKRDQADRLQATAPQIRRLLREVGEGDLEARRGLTGIGPKRAEIIVAGVAVLNEVMEEFNLPRLYYSTAGLRDGIVADLARRRVVSEASRMDADQRRVVQALARRYDIPTAHARKVAQMATMLFDELRPVHRLPQSMGRLLEAAAHLYNIGHFVNEQRHHRHSLYLVANADLPGFPDRDRLLIANLCRYHRKSMPQPSHESFQLLDAEARRAVVLMAPILRIAAALDQSQEQRVERIDTIISDRGVEIRLVSERDVDIEQWHAEQVAEVFREVYGRQLAIKAKR